MKRALTCKLLLLSALVCSMAATAQEDAMQEEEADPAEIAIGERLFLETRFAQYFAQHQKGGDPVVAATETLGEPLVGPFAGQSINCSSCHLVDQQLETAGGGMRTYSDYARRSPVPAREDGMTHAVRNSQQLVNNSAPREVGLSFHHDGEFATLQQLVEDTLSGRNYGWLPGERAQAVEQVAKIIRNDNGQGELAQEFGGAYGSIFKATDSSIPEELRLPEMYRLDVAQADDEAIFSHVAKLIAVYVEDLAFLKDEHDRYNGSPYDVFLAKNGLPLNPSAGESPQRYSQRLLQKVSRLSEPKYVAADEGAFAYHDQAFVFGPQELRGMLLFFSRSNARQPEAKAANCVSCHPAPDFTDYAFHNTGMTQLTYDGVHGAGSFNALTIPGLKQRNAEVLKWLPANEKHPTAAEPFRRVPQQGKPEWVDLGAWNIFANPDYPASQTVLRHWLCEEQTRALMQGPRLLWQADAACDDAALLARSIAAFKTPTLRDLGHSQPYMHNGGFSTLEEVAAFYLLVSQQAQKGQLRNPAPGLADVKLDSEDLNALVAFLRSLNEDYE